MNNLLALVILFLLNVQSCDQTDSAGKNKVHGIALESPARPSAEDVMSELVDIGADHVCLMPYSFLPDEESELIFDQLEWQWWGESSKGIETMIMDAHSKGLKVLLKPHVWSGWGQYTGDIAFEDSQAQSNWNNTYAKYILHYAAMAEKNGVEMLCIGTELCKQVVEQDSYWSVLIDSVRAQYSGDLTYAANWDTYQDFPMWDKLDMIGVDAYFPLTDDEAPEIEKLLVAWTPWKVRLEHLADSTDRPILFTEYGYRSKEGCVAEPWVSGTGEDGIANDDQQMIAYQALYQSIWHEPWFAGGFVWKWHCQEHLKTEKRTKDYTPQGKPAEQIISRHYRAYSLEKGAE